MIGRTPTPCDREDHYFVDSTTGECVECRQDATEGRTLSCIVCDATDVPLRNGQGGTQVCVDATACSERQFRAWEPGRVASPWITSDEPCPSGDTDCTVDCGSCKGTGRKVTGRVPSRLPANDLCTHEVTDAGRCTDCGFTVTGRTATPEPSPEQRERLGPLLDAPVYFENEGRTHSDVLPSTRAAEIAREAHAGQLDKIGKAYIGHPARIAKAVRSEGYSDEVEAVAWLHDVVEDTAWTLEMLAAEGFSPAVIAAVDAISKRTGEPFAAYYERVKANPMALVVKWHDVADNADPARLALVAPDTRDRLREKYERAKALLSTPARTTTPPPASPA